MRITAPSVRLFNLAAHLWLIVFLLTRISAFEYLWEYPVSPALPANGILSFVTDAFGTWLPSEALFFAVPLLLVLAVRNLFLPRRWYFALPVWVIYTGLMHRAWLAGSGGQQFMGIVFFWLIFIDGHALGPKRSVRAVLSTFGLWVVRLQLLLVYFATAAHKITGAAWRDGTAVGIVATDSSYDLGWLAAMPWLGLLLTWLLFAFMVLFPLAVWWRPSRRIFLAAGLAFHLATALFLGIPEMGTAFIVVYTLWLDEDEAMHFLRPFEQMAAMRRTRR